MDNPAYPDALLYATVCMNGPYLLTVVKRFRREAEQCCKFACTLCLRRVCRRSFTCHSTWGRPSNENL